MKRVVLCVIAMTMISALAVMAADEKKPAAPATDPMALVVPGEHHKHIEKLAGNFDYTIKMYIPGQPAPTESTGKRSATMVLGGRYLEEKFTGTFMGMPFEGVGTMAYDNVQKKYISTWIDNMGTGIMVATGQCDTKGPSWTMTGEMADPMSGTMIQTRSVTKIVDADHFVMEMYGPGPDGKEMKMMEIAATRTK